MIATRILAVALMGALLALAACDRPRSTSEAPAPVAGAFVHTAGDDQSGYYRPRAEVTAGAWRLDHLFLGQPADFAAWAAGTRQGVFAPVMLEFVDQNSPLVDTELGQVRSGRVRVLPDRYEVTDDRVVFSGRAEGVGQVAFEGRLDAEALAVARRNLGDEGVVLDGRLTVGGHTTPVALSWWAGD